MDLMGKDVAKFFILISSLIATSFLVVSCAQKKEALHITVKDYHLLNESYDLFSNNSKQEIVQINCTTNFPKGSLIVVKKGLRINATNADLLKGTALIDTIKVEQGSFKIGMSPFFIGGYLNFSVLKDNQNGREILQEAIYNAEYNIEFEKGKTANGIDIPKKPIQLKIERIKE